MTDDGRAVVDAHIHQWDPFTTPRVVSGIAKIVRRAPFLLPALARIFPRSSREFVGDPRYLLNAYLPGDYRADASSARVGTVVHIEAGWKTKTPIGSVAETHWVARGAGRPLRRSPDARWQCAPRLPHVMQCD